MSHINLEYMTTVIKKNTAINQVLNKNNRNILDYENYKKNLLRACMNRINSETLRGNYDVIFNLPKRDNIQNERECLEYLENELREQNFNTLICKNASSIFISWYHIIH